MAAEAGGQAEVRLRRITHPARIIVFLVVIAVLLAGSFLAGQALTSPTDQALRAAPDAVPVTARVETRVVSTGIRIAASVRAGTTVAVYYGGAARPAEATPPEPAADVPPEAAGAAPAGQKPAQKPSEAAAGTPADETVLSDVRVEAGETLGFIRLIAEISGRPVVTIPASVPLYRDLVVGDRGNDVRALQRVLVDAGHGHIRVTGTLTAADLAVFTTLYRAAGYALSTIGDRGPGLARAEFIALPAGGLPIITIAPVGTGLSGGTPLLSLGDSPATIVGRASVVQGDRLAVGTAVQVTAGGGVPLASEVVALGEVGTDESTGGMGRDVTVRMPDDPEGVLTAAAMIQILSGDIGTEGAAIPVIAIRQDERGSYVRLARPEGEGPTPTAATDARRVDLTVTAQAEGWAAIEPREDLPVGTALEVGP
ncbi:hypothetical protein D9V32_13050 [Mycetocola tolaasinivorans]|uniref:Peptidoglycan-binding protein n=1 Tax=Mycetocola tolaasinivorans TaxID=76635 RepID=A0A3L7A2Q0_9MICO|nr:hypothetical protein [Mycetocola tolaasinivorans]RLP74278.1 hypothetical protein D9V32_13050 [Mycetocola tolaasinivorans]